MAAKYGIKVFAPAVIGNMNIGFDILGTAVDGLGDSLIVKEGKSQGVILSSIHGDSGSLPRDNTNTAVYAANKVLELAGIKDVAIELELFKGMPFYSGLGSSAASAVAGAFGTNAFLGKPLSKNQVMRSAAQAEMLATNSFILDNIAPCLLGGIVLIRDNESMDTINLPVPLGLSVLVINPKLRVSTVESRNSLKNSIDIASFIKQSGNLASFVASLYKSDFDLMKRSLVDHVIEKQRAVHIPVFYDLKEASLNAGALGFGISGSGPSMFAFCNNSLIAENIGNEAKRICKENNIEVSIHHSAINKTGARIY